LITIIFNFSSNLFDIKSEMFFKIYNNLTFIDYIGYIYLIVLINII